jgi:transcriptional regulator with XRE-family HTH domain
LNDYDILLKNILDLIKKSGLTEKKVLLDTGINTSFFSDWKNNRLKNPSIDKIKAIANYLDVSVDYLLGRTDKPEVNK